MRTPNLRFLILVFSFGMSGGPIRAADFAPMQKFLAAHCVKCHGPDKQSGGVRLDDLPAEPAKDAERWAAVRDQVRDGLMPPAKRPRPDPTAARQLVAWATAGLTERPPRLPNQGNLVPHELLFGPSAIASEPPPPRVWRLSPTGYNGLLADIYRGRLPPLTQPFTLTSDRGIRDYAGLYAIDEPATEILIRNAEIVVQFQTGHITKGGNKGRQMFGDSPIPEFARLMDPAKVPTHAELTAAVQLQFRLAIGRRATAAEVDRFLRLYESCATDGDRPAAVRTMLQAALLKTHALYRSEIGAGTGKRRMLTSNEIARAISLALGDRREAALFATAEKGQLTTPEQVAVQVRRILDDPKANKPRLLGFFHEYFEYHKAPTVFKDKPSDIVHRPDVLVSDTDRLILHILAEDKDVFARLLTTRKSFVNYSIQKDKKTRQLKAKPAFVPNPHNDKGRKGVEGVYGVTEFPPNQPTDLPAGERIGVLMQPSWLVAWSTNFDNDPIRRGRWVRERLLGGTVPDIPIGVNAKVPDEPDRPFRHRLRVTRTGRCWTCHQKMDDLGLPFEQFDHLGRFRTAEAVLDSSVPAAASKGKKPVEPARRLVPLDTTGRITDAGDPALEGPVRNPVELVRRLASSDRCRQVFVRHAFRYFLGRNESLADARTLQRADRAFVESDGSFKSLVVALLTSDTFLYRSAPGEHP